MTISCLLAISSPAGNGFAQVKVNSLHQLALVMPAGVVSYEVHQIEEMPGCSTINDAELFDLLTGLLKDIEFDEQIVPILPRP